MGYKEEVTVIIVRGQQKGVVGSTDTIQVRKITK
jgi:hypothetical protein